MFSLAMEQFCAATAQVVHHVEGLQQHLFLRRRAFREGLAEAAALNDAQTELYRLDVGGAHFHTQIEVLNRHKGMLSVMASDDFTHDVEGGKYAFLDRDPTWFPLVLRFLRTGVALLPEDAERRAAVFREAQYYSLEDLCKAARPVQERISVLVLDRQTNYFFFQVYNPSQGSWARMDFSMGVFSCRDKYLLCAGDGSLFALGISTDEAVGSDTFKFWTSRLCPSASSWDPIVSVTCPQDWLEHWEDYAWAYGRGCIYGTLGKTVLSLNVSTRSFRLLPKLSSTRDSATPCVVDGRIFVIGGGTASVEEYQAQQQRWVSVPDMPRAVSAAAAVAFDGKLLVVGGRDSDGNTLSAVLEYDLGDGSWKELPSLLNARSRCVVIVLRGDVVVLGGSQGDGPSDEGLASAERYNRQSQCWEAMPSLTNPSLNLVAAVVQV
jgi:hypothetical protein